jgi:iron complex transport system ATP-binding protein
MTDLKIKNISVTVENKEILKDISLSFDRPELIGLIGPNGAGKTTLLNALATLLPQNQILTGTVELEGVLLKNMSHKHRAQKIAYLAQQHDVHWPISVRTLISLGRHPFLTPFRQMTEEDNSIILKAMNATDCLELKNQKIETLSGGEIARVMLARALASETPILLADEPMASLDPHHQLKVMEILKEKATRGTIVICVLHDLTIASRFCDRLILLHEGKMIVEGKNDEVLQNHYLEKTYQVEVFKGNHEGTNFIIPLNRI